MTRKDFPHSAQPIYVASLIKTGALCGDLDSQNNLSTPCAILLLRRFSVGMRSIPRMPDGAKSSFSPVSRVLVDEACQVLGDVIKSGTINGYNLARWSAQRRATSQICTDDSFRSQSEKNMSKKYVNYVFHRLPACTDRRFVLYIVGRKCRLLAAFHVESTVSLNI